MKIPKEKKEKLIALSDMIFKNAQILKESKGDFIVNSPAVDHIIIACLKHKQVSGVSPQESLSIIQKLLK